MCRAKEIKNNNPSATKKKKNCCSCLSCGSWSGRATGYWLQATGWTAAAGYCNPQLALPLSLSISLSLSFSAAAAAALRISSLPPCIRPAPHPPGITGAPCSSFPPFQLLLSRVRFLSVRHSRFPSYLPMSFFLIGLHWRVCAKIKHFNQIFFFLHFKADINKLSIPYNLG